MQKLPFCFIFKIYRRLSLRKSPLTYLNPFILSAIEIIRKTTGMQVAKKGIAVKRGKKSLGGVGVILDLKGDIAGKVVYEFSRLVTMRISSAMLKESQIVTNNKEEYRLLLESAILELGNQISGYALSHLLKNGYNCDITPPQFYLGKDKSVIPFYLTTFIMDFTSNFGDFSINLSLVNKKQIRGMLV